MSNLTAPAGPRTITVPGDGTNTLSVTLPPGVTLDVQAVLANIDAAGAGDTLAELTIAEQAGVVIATKRQGEPIPAGDTGTATWALRLDDEAAAVSSGTQSVTVLWQVNNAGIGNVYAVDPAGPFGISGVQWESWFTAYNTNGWTWGKDGTYLIVMVASFGAPNTGIGAIINGATRNDPPGFPQPGPSLAWVLSQARGGTGKAGFSFTPTVYSTVVPVGFQTIALNIWRISPVADET